MATTCPKCKRNSLEFSEVRKVAWCLYSECGYEKSVGSYNDYIKKFANDKSCESLTKKAMVFLKIFSS
jgi:hypothetical protein